MQSRLHQKKIDKLWINPLNIAKLVRIRCGRSIATALQLSLATFGLLITDRIVRFGLFCDDLMDQVSQQNLKENQLPQSHCTVLLSGGIDSAACVDFYQRQHFSVQGLHVTYGQPAANQESAAASAIANYYRIPLTQISMIGARPKSEAEFLGRNALLLFTALLELDPRAAMLVLGVHSGTAYYDCSPSFLSTVQAIIDGQCDGRVRVAAPFLDWTKKQIWEYCVEHQVPLQLTYSCERGLDQPCGACLTCRDLEAIRAG